MTQDDLIRLYTQDQRINVEYTDARREVLSNIVRHVSLTKDSFNTILYTNLNEETAEVAIDEQIAYFEKLGKKFEWKLFDYDTPPDLKARLATKGFTMGPAEAIMVLDLETASPYLFEPVTSHIRRITNPNDLSIVEQIENVVWSEDHTDLINYLRLNLTETPNQMHVYVAYVNQIPASCGWIYFPKNSQFASLWGGSTVPQYRGMGLYTALLSTRAQLASQRGIRFLTVDASPMSRPILEKHGFVTLTYSYPCEWDLLDKDL